MQEGTRLSASYVNVKSVGNEGNFSLNLEVKRSRLRTVRTNYPIAQSTTFMTLIRYTFSN